MLKINMSSNLNNLDTEIHSRLSEECKSNPKLTIVEAANLCHCSPSKISKFVKKAGFENYKQYVNYICNRVPIPKTFSNEFERIHHFLDTFDLSIIDEFITKISNYKKIVLVGYGPSKYCALYFQFKLQLFCQQTVLVIEDEISAPSLLDSDSILIVFSATGAYHSFRHYQTIAQEKQAAFLLLVEEYNPSVIPDYGEIIFLTDSFQTISTIPYEKSRIVFFIFIEEVISHFIQNKS